MSLLKSKIAKDAFQSEAETLQKELKQHLETSQEGLGEKKKQKEGPQPMTDKLSGFTRKSNNNVPIIQQ